MIIASEFGSTLLYCLSDHKLCLVWVVSKKMSIRSISLLVYSRFNLILYASLSLLFILFLINIGKACLRRYKPSSILAIPLPLMLPPTSPFIKNEVNFKLGKIHQKFQFFIFLNLFLSSIAKNHRHETGLHFIHS